MTVGQLTKRLDDIRHKERGIPQAHEMAEVFDALDEALGWQARAEKAERELAALRDGVTATLHLSMAAVIDPSTRDASATLDRAQKAERAYEILLAAAREFLAESNANTGNESPVCDRVYIALKNAIESAPKNPR